MAPSELGFFRSAQSLITSVLIYHRSLLLATNSSPSLTSHLVLVISLKLAFFRLTLGTWPLLRRNTMDATDELLDSRRELVRTQLRLERVQRELDSLHAEHAAQIKLVLEDLTHTRRQRDEARALAERFKLDLGQLEKASAGNSSLNDELAGARRDVKDRKVECQDLRDELQRERESMNRDRESWEWEKVQLRSRLMRLEDAANETRTEAPELLQDDLQLGLDEGNPSSEWL